MPYVSLPDIRLYYDEFRPPETSWVSSTPVVFLHGFTVDRRMWRPQVEHFKERYRVVAVDSRGHGLSDAPETNYSRDDRVRDLAGFIDVLGLEKVHLVGLSMGGTTGIGFALQHPDRLQSMTLISTGAAGYRPGKKIDKLDQIARTQGVDAVMEKWKEIAVSWLQHKNPDIAGFMLEMINDHSGAVWADPRRGKYARTYDLDRVHQIGTPTLILAGALDRIFVPLAEQLHERMPDSRLLIYDDVGHMLNLEAPERCNSDIERFLHEVSS